MIIVGMVIAAIVAGFVGSDASKRGMNPTGWFIGVFLLLIVFLPVYLIVRRPLLPQYQAQLPQLQHTSNELLAAASIPSLCPHCGKYHSGNANFCPYCGKSQELSQVGSG